MPAVAVDTHAIAWYLAGDPRLSAKATAALDQATAEGEPIHVPPVFRGTRAQRTRFGPAGWASSSPVGAMPTRPVRCLVELTYLVEKGRLTAAARESVIGALDDSATPCRLAPLDRAVADSLEFVSRKEVPDLPDRIESATAVALRVPLISRDGKIRTSHVRTIW